VSTSITLFVVSSSKQANAPHLFTDDGGRYSYKNQPEICHWNCKKLAEALALAVPLDELESQLDKTYWPEFNQHYNEKMRKKVIFHPPYPTPNKEQHLILSPPSSSAFC